MATPNVTTIQVTPQVRDRLKQFGLKGQSYSEVLDRLMDAVEHDKFMEEQYRRLANLKDFVPLRGRR